MLGGKASNMRLNKNSGSIMGIKDAEMADDDDDDNDDDYDGEEYD